MDVDGVTFKRVHEAFREPIALRAVMKQKGEIPALLLILGFLLLTIESGVPIYLGLASDAGRGLNAMVPPQGRR